MDLKILWTVIVPSGECIPYTKSRDKLNTASQRQEHPMNVNFRKISVRKTIWELEFSEHLL